MSVSKKDIDRCIVIAREFGAVRLILFGSALTNPDQASDLDLGCEGVEGWNVYRLGARLEDELRMRIDLVALSANDRFSDYVRTHGRVIYEAE